VLKKLKEELRPLIATTWLEQATNMAAYLTATREVGPVKADITLTNRVQGVSSARRLSFTRLQRWVHALEAKEISQPDHPLFAWTRLLTLTNPPSAASLDQELQSLLTNSHRTSYDPSEAACCDPEAFAEFSGTDFAGWSMEDEAFGSSPSHAGDFVVGDLKRPVRTLLTAPAANSASISRRLEGVLRSPTFTIQNRYAHILASGSGSRLNVRVDNFTMIREPIYGGLKRLLDNESPEWITIDLDTWKGHRAYFEFDDLTTPDPSDDADKQFPKLAWLTVSRVVFSDNATPPHFPIRSPLISPEDLSKAISTPGSAGVSPASWELARNS
jgi:hypothetical protein